MSIAQLILLATGHELHVYGPLANCTTSVMYEKEPLTPLERVRNESERSNGQKKLGTSLNAIK